MAPRGSSGGVDGPRRDAAGWRSVRADVRGVTGEKKHPAGRLQQSPRAPPQRQPPAAAPCLTASTHILRLSSCYLLALAEPSELAAPAVTCAAVFLLRQGARYFVPGGMRQLAEHIARGTALTTVQRPCWVRGRRAPDTGATPASVSTSACTCPFLPVSRRERPPACSGNRDASSQRPSSGP